MIALRIKKNRLKVDSSLTDHSTDAFVVKKLEAAKSLIKKVGLPKEVKK